MKIAWDTAGSLNNEERIINLTVELYNSFCELSIFDSGFHPTMMKEVAHHIHGIQGLMGLMNRGDRFLRVKSVQENTDTDT
tara:strand:+ start:982 stop:1224 length:243 start_codon:yes stop_codon:yes gene_type:complete